MKFLLEQIRKKYRGIKIIVSEIIPRNDSRDQEGQAFNELLNTYAEVHSDITVACHRNLRDPQWSMLYDQKHIRKEKVPKFAANLIRALKSAYGISNKAFARIKVNFLLPINEKRTSNEIHYSNKGISITSVVRTPYTRPHQFTRILILYLIVIYVVD